MNDRPRDDFRNDDDFDRAMRGRYLVATQHLSPMTQARLRAGRHAAGHREHMPVRGWGMGAVAGGLAAAVFAVAFGLNFSARPQHDEISQTAGPSGTSNMIATADDAPGVTALDQDPEFYAWLASSDAQLMAME
ncbi:MAG: hypothetical protein ABIO38_06265 [Luteimonas sp.]